MRGGGGGGGGGGGARGGVCMARTRICVRSSPAPLRGGGTNKASVMKHRCQVQ
jgi:hypothetical protein